VRLSRLLGVALAAAALAGCGASEARVPNRIATETPSPRLAPRTDPAAVAARAHVPVLCYHQIRDPTAADSAGARTYIVSPSALAAQMGALDRAGYTPVTGDQLVAHLARGAPLPRRPVLLTFDDSSAGQYENALPILRRHHFVATFFVMTVVLGKPGWLTRGQVRALDRAGMTIAAHTWDHKEVPKYTAADFPVELVSPRRELEKLVGHKVRLFAYPDGAWSPDGFGALRAAGYVAAFQLADKLDRRAPLLTIRRIIVPSISGAQLLRQIRQDF
jgi:peptidoglycan/xylan/chitin deacetylase (PgdA/CDA1 family)